MIPLVINNALFFPWKSGVESSFYLAGDNTTDEMRRACVEYSFSHGCNGLVLCLNNEERMSLFRDEYMRNVDWQKFDKLMEFVRYVHALAGKIVFAFYDGPPIPDAKYPCLRFMDRHAEFIRQACAALNTYAAAYLIGIETNEYWSVDIVRQAIAETKKHAGLIPVGSHEQWRPDGREFCGGDFCCYETQNHPADGDNISVAAMVDEVRFVQSRLPPGVPMWVCEFNLHDSEHARAQARAMAELPGVVGIGGVL